MILKLKDTDFSLEEEFNSSIASINHQLSEQERSRLRHAFYLGTIAAEKAHQRYDDVEDWEHPDADITMHLCNQIDDYKVEISKRGKTSAAND